VINLIGTSSHIEKKKEKNKTYVEGKGIIARDFVFDRPKHNRVYGSV
jgi:hypothetical protein